MNVEVAPIFEKVYSLFMRYGVKSMTMNDIAVNLGISKKTLYKYVEDKNDLVTKLIRMGSEEEQCLVQDITHSGMNAIDQSFEITRLVTEKLNSIHPSVFYDIKKYHPKAWSIFTEHKETCIAKWVEDNLNKGIEEGLYRDDLKVSIIRDLYMARIDDILEQKYPSVEHYNFTEIYLESFRYHIRGIASEKGIKYLVDKIKKEKSRNS